MSRNLNLYYLEMENHVKNHLDLQAAPRGQQAEINMTSRLNLLLRRKGCLGGDFQKNQTTIDHNNVASNKVIINQQQSVDLYLLFKRNKTSLARVNCWHPIASQANSQIKSTKNVTKTCKQSQLTYRVNHLNGWVNMLIAMQLVLIVFIVAACADPNPATTVVQATNNSGGARSATTKALRGPPMNGSIFGKRSIMPNQHNKNSRHQTQSTASHNEPQYEQISTNEDNSDNNKRQSVEEYNDVITEIIEDFLAKNAYAEPEDASRAFCRMIVYECNQFLAKSSRRSLGLIKTINKPSISKQTRRKEISTNNNNN